jgi:L-alanine-DL-glutamate epimerase-like enolase superfamily enzyme
MKAVKSNRRIRRVSAVPVRVPRVAPLKSALGTSVTGSFGIVEVETEEGLSGLGEISMIWNGGGAALCPMVNELLGPALIGQSAFAIKRAHQIMDETVQFSRAANPAKAAIDMALYDIVGKALGTPVLQPARRPGARRRPALAEHHDRVAG